MSRCKACSAEIIWLPTTRGKQIPLDAEPNPNGNVVIADVAGRKMANVLGQQAAAQARHAIEKGAQLGPLHMPHHATCPNWGK